MGKRQLACGRVTRHYFLYKRIIFIKFHSTLNWARSGAERFSVETVCRSKYGALWYIIDSNNALLTTFGTNWSLRITSFWIENQKVAIGSWLLLLKRFGHVASSYSVPLYKFYHSKGINANKHMLAMLTLTRRTGSGCNRVHVYLRKMQHITHEKA